MTDMKDIFEFTEIENDMTGIRITEGDYKGLHWTFGTVQFLDPEESPTSNESCGFMECKFDYVIHDNPFDYEENQDMTNFMGDILIEVLDEELKDDSFNIEDIPMPPASMADQLIDNKVIADTMREEAVNDND